MQINSSSKLSSRPWRSLGGACLFLLAGAVAASQPLHAAPLARGASAKLELPNTLGQEQGIAAIVNDEVISRYDLDQRIKLVISSAGVVPSPEELKQLEKQVIRNLIDEKLKWQEAKRVNEMQEKHQEIIDNNEIVEQLQNIAQRSGMTVPDIQADLERRGIKIFTLTDQIKVDIAWQRLVQGRFGPEAKIDTTEIDRIINEARANVAKPQYNVMEIMLPIDSPRDEQKVLDAAHALLAQIRKGVPFPQVAQQYSQGPSAAGGGDLGWVTLGQLPEDIDRWLRTAHRGSLTDEPIRTIGAYYLIGVKDTRNVASGPSSPQTPLFLKRVVMPLSASASPERAMQVLAQMKAAASKIRGCNTLAEAVNSLPGAQIVDLGTKPLIALAPRDQARVVRLVSGQASDPGDRTNEGYDMIVLCGHAEEQAQGVPTRDQVADRLYDQQLSMLSRRYLRDLRRDAVIDNRLGGD